MSYLPVRGIMYMSMAECPKKGSRESKKQQIWSQK